MRHEGVLRHLLVRKGLKTGEMLICLVTSSQGEINSAEGKQLLEKYKDTLLGVRDDRDVCRYSAYDKR